MRLVDIFFSCASLCLLVAALPRQNGLGRELSRASSRQEAINAADEEIILEGVPLHDRDNIHGLLHFNPEPFNAINPHTGTIDEIDHESDLGGVHPIDIYREGPLPFLARRMQAYRAYRQGQYVGDYELDRENDLARHTAMSSISNLEVGAFFTLGQGDPIIYYNRLRPWQDIIEEYNRGVMPLLYTDQDGRLHFITSNDPTYR